LLEEAQQGSSQTECEKTGHCNGPRSSGEVHAPFVRLEQVGDETIPWRRDEMSEGKIHSDGCDEQPWSLVRPEQRQCKNREPGNRLSDNAPKNLSGSAGEPRGDFDGNQLSPCAQELGMAERMLNWYGVAWRSKAKAERYCSPPPWATAWNRPSRMPKRRPDSWGPMQAEWLAAICSAECDDAGWAVIIRKPRALYHRTDIAQGFIG